MGEGQFITWPRMGVAESLPSPMGSRVGSGSAARAAQESIANSQGNFLKKYTPASGRWVAAILAARPGS
jgi:hypothetical protein